MAENLMAPGGGLTKSKLALANLKPEEASEGKTFYAEDKTLKTGTLIERGNYQYASNIRAGADERSNFISLYGIPEGIYRKTQEDWAPEIRFPKINTINFLFNPIILYNSWIKINEQTTDHRYNGTFGMEKDNILMFVILGGDRDGNRADLGISTPGCTTLMEIGQNISQDTALMHIGLLIRIVRVDSPGTATTSVYAPGVRGVGYFGVFRLLW